MLHLKNKNIVLASKSPRRQHLLKELDIDFEIRTKDIEEKYPSHLKGHEVPLFLSELKAKAFENELLENDILITSDTIVALNNKVIGKPKDRDDAFNMLNKLSGNAHHVITAFTLSSTEKKQSHHVVTKVFFKSLTTKEINYYLDNYKPYDKAGSYGIQEWIGFIGIEKIEGSYYNVMGLPVKEVYEALIQFSSETE